MEAALLKKWESVASRFQELTDQLMDPSVVSQPGQLHKQSKERMDLEPAAHRTVIHRVVVSYGVSGTSIAYHDSFLGGRRPST